MGDLTEALDWFEGTLHLDHPGFQGSKLEQVLAAARNWHTLTEPGDEIVEQVARAIAQFFDDWCDDAPFWPTADLHIHNYDIRDDARKLLDALTDTAETETEET